MFQQIPQLISQFFAQKEVVLALSVILSLVPAMIWLKIWYSRRQNNKQSMDLLKVFVLGFLSIIPVLGFQYMSNCQAVSFLGLFSFRLPCLPTGWNPLLFIEQATHNPTLKSALVFAFFAALEEIGKLSIVKYVDFNGKRVNTINDALIFSLIAALSFSFVENIMYFDNILLSGDYASVFSVFVFRAVFTATAHVIFSGIAGYYYGLAKFSSPITEIAYWKKESYWLPNLAKKFFGASEASALKVQLVLRGLWIATLAHATFNFLLERHEVLWVILLVIAGAFYIVHLIQRKSGALFLRMTNARPSTMSPKDEEVVLELIGMWLNEEKYDEVMKICERLLERDPDNNVVKLFLAEAHHQKELGDAYKAIAALFTHKS